VNAHDEQPTLSSRIPATQPLQRGRGKEPTERPPHGCPAPSSDTPTVIRAQDNTAEPQHFAHSFGTGSPHPPTENNDNREIRMTHISHRISAATATQLQALHTRRECADNVAPRDLPLNSLRQRSVRTAANASGGVQVPPAAGREPMGAHVGSVFFDKDYLTESNSGTDPVVPSTEQRACATSTSPKEPAADHRERRHVETRQRRELVSPFRAYSRIPNREGAR